MELTARTALAYKNMKMKCNFFQVPMTTIYNLLENFKKIFCFLNV